MKSNERVPVLILMVAGAVAWTQTESRHYISASTRRMAERLEELARTTIPPNPAMTSERIKNSRRQIVESRDPLNAFELQMELGYELLLDGKSEEAAHELREAEQLLVRRKPAVKPELTRVLGQLLAISYLRLGEQENCVAQHNSESCYLPIRASGIHKKERGSRAAIEVLMKGNPGDLSSRWLLNLAHMTLGEYPERVPRQWLLPPAIFESDYRIERFQDIAPRVGLDLLGRAGGSIIEDFDADGDLDIMASSCGFRDQLRYFRNNGDGTFTERTAEAGLTGEVGGLNITHGDYNNDGYPDVLVLRGAWLYDQGEHPNSLLRNNRDGTFDDVTEEAGLLTFHPTQTAAWGDFDNDGWVDIFVGNESDGRKTRPCQLFHNNGDGTFTECADGLGIAAVGYVKGVAWGDYNNDGWLDLYVSRMGGTNILYRNEGPKRNPESAGKSGMEGWKFTDVTNQAGVGKPIQSFATWFWDYNNDGWLDIFVAGFTPQSPRSLDDVVAIYSGLPSAAERSRLFRNNRDGTFSDVTRAARIDRVVQVMGANFGDLDNDGFQDCYLGTGEPDLRVLIPNRMFRNAGGHYFQDVTTSGGFGHLQKGHGVSFGDIDNDGDQDIYEVIGGWYSGDIFQNVLFENPGNRNHWITLKLEGVRSNRAAIGARIKVTVDTAEGKREIHSTVSTGGSFGSSSLQQEIGLGRAASLRTIEITWPATGRIEIIRDVAMDQMFRIREGQPVPIPVKLQQFKLAGADAQSGSARPPHHDPPYQ
jgi:FG-GAP-like repeat/ASPIC and UnbV